MKDLMAAIKGLQDIKSILAQQFLVAVRDQNTDISDRLTLWENYAKDLLPVGSWASEAPEWIIENNDYHRNALIQFSDLIEQLDDDELEFDTNGKLIGLTNEAVEKIEEVFATGLSGTEYDW